MLSRLFDHCILTKYSDVIQADCYNTFQQAMNEYSINPHRIYKNHIKYIHIFKYHPARIKQFFYNREFDVAIKYTNKIIENNEKI